MVAYQCKYIMHPGNDLEIFFCCCAKELEGQLLNSLVMRFNFKKVRL